MDFPLIPEFDRREVDITMNNSKLKLCAFADEADPTIDGQIEALKENDISLLEIRVADNKNISSVTLDEAREIKRKLDSVGISVWSLGSPAGKIDINDDFDKEIEQFKRMLEAGAILDAKCMRLFSFYGTNAQQEYHSDVCEKLNKYVELCKPYGIIPCHENEKDIYGEDAAHCLEILKAVPGLKAVFDPANFVQAGQDTLIAWEMLKDYVYYMHIKDADADGKIVPPGWGIGHLPEILTDFAALGGYVLTLEPHLRGFVGLDSLENGNTKSNIGSINFSDNRESFTFAANSLKKVLSDCNL